MRSEGGTIFSIMVWKYMFVCIILSGYIIPHLGGFEQAWTYIKRGPHFLLLGVFFQLCATYLFTFALLKVCAELSLLCVCTRGAGSAACVQTVAARALLFYSLNPIWTALLGWLLLHEPLHRRTVVATIGAMISICIIFLPAILGNPSSTSSDHASLVGDVAGLLVSVASGLYIVSVRYVAKKCASTVSCPPLSRSSTRGPLCARDRSFPMSLATCISALTSVCISLAVRAVLRTPVQPTGSMARFIAFAFCDSLTIASFYIGLNNGPKYISSTEVSLISLLETLLGPLWVFLVFDEVPSVYTIAGGLLLLSCILAHELTGAHQRRRVSLRYIRSMSSADLDLVVVDDDQLEAASSCRAPVSPTAVEQRSPFLAPRTMEQTEILWDDSGVEFTLRDSPVSSPGAPI
jgi:drug/metabolite transporter (DMT)-like permease